jgi:exodeoxyribonuclease-3
LAAMIIITWNVNGIRSIIKSQFLEFIKKMRPDILCLQETRAEEAVIYNVLAPLEGYKIYCNSGTKKGYAGTAILTRIDPMKVTLGLDMTDTEVEGRLQCASFTDFYLVNVYVPNSGQKLDRLKYRKKWDADFLVHLKTLEQNKPVIACGDFNVAHCAIDLSKPTANYNKTAGYTQIEIDGMNNLIHSGFVDSFRHLHPDEKAYTYWSYRFKARERNIGWRLDYFLLSSYLKDKIKAVRIHSEIIGSDHCPLQLELGV